MQKHVNLVDLVKSFPTHIFLQNLASIQKRTSPVKFAYLAEESDNGSVPNLSTKDFACEMGSSPAQFIKLPTICVDMNPIRAAGPPEKTSLGNSAEISSQIFSSEGPELKN